MAELLVRAKNHWMDELTQKEVDALPDGNKETYTARSQKGDIIVVKPDGWIWGKSERLPNYVVVKVPGMKYEDAKKYEESLLDTTGEEPITLRKRKHNILGTDVDAAITAKTDTVELTKSVTESKIVVKTGDSKEVIQPKVI